MDIPIESSQHQAKHLSQEETIRLEGRKKECVLSKTAGKKTPKVKRKNKCQECGDALCKVRCFVEYHSTDA